MRLEKKQIEVNNLKEEINALARQWKTNEKFTNCESENKVLKNNLKHQQFGYEKFIDDDGKMVFYIGLNSKQFNAFWAFIEPELSMPIRKGISRKN